MKVLLISHIFPPAVDGGSRIVWKIGEYLQKNGHQVSALTTNCQSTDDFVTPSSATLHKTDLINHIPITRLPVYKRLTKPLKALILITPLFPKLNNFLKLLKKGPIFKIIPLILFLRQLKTQKPDLIIAGPLPTTIIYLSTHLLRYSSKLLSVPCFHPQDSDFQNPLLLSALAKSDHIFCFTQTEKDILATKSIKPIKIFTQFPGLDPDFILPLKNISFPKNPNLLFVGNFSAHKRVELLIDAFIKLKNKYPKLSLTLLGQKTLYWPQIRTKIDKLSSSDIKIIFNPTKPQIKKAYDQSTLLCLPSVHESFGLVFIENLARGKPVVGADTPQTHEVISTLNGGLTFKTDNLNDLTAKIDTLLSNPKLAQKLGTKGHHFVSSHLTWDKIILSLEKQINEI